VTTAAAAPIPTCRAPENSTPAPGQQAHAGADREQGDETENDRGAEANGPPIRKGRTGTKAPTAKAANDPPAARPRSELVGVETKLLADEAGRAPGSGSWNRRWAIARASSSWKPFAR
jgi:hypothetical protein